MLRVILTSWLGSQRQGMGGSCSFSNNSSTVSSHMTEVLVLVLFYGFFFVHTQILLFILTQTSKLYHITSYLIYFFQL